MMQTSVQNSSTQQQQPLVQADPTPPPPPPPPKLPRQDLMNGPKRDYLRIGVPLYEASIKCDWEAAKYILDMKPELVRFSITENAETALHIAASAKGPKHVEKFVKNLVDRMTKDDLAFVNKNHNTALYLAAAAGNLETVKIMVNLNRALLIIPGARGTMMPLYAAVLFGNYEVVKYLYHESHDLSDDGWTDTNRSWLLEKCVESGMFDIAIEIVKRYPMLGKKSTLLGILARKPEAFQKKESSITERTIKLRDYLYNLMFTTHQPSERNQPEPRIQIVRRDSVVIPLEAPPTKKSNIIIRTINSVSEFFVGSPEKETKALQFLRLIWDDIVKLSKKEIDNILRGSRDSIKSESDRIVPTVLQQLIFEHLEKMEGDCRNVNQVTHLKRLVSQHVVNMHLETQNIILQDNKTLSGKGDQHLEIQKTISEYIVGMSDETEYLIKNGAGKEDLAVNLQELISKNITRMHDAISLKEKYSSRVMFIAAEVGNTNFLVELIRRIPDLIWKVDDNGLSIFHVAVKNRHEGIYNLLYEIGAMKDMVTPLKDNNENNMLHLAAMSTRKKNLEDVSGAALQMQRDLLWFKEVEDMIPPSYRERKNKDGFTPRELFTMEHEYLITQGEKWMKSTASQCMVVATLIATIVFAAAFTVPGGYDQNDGIPMFKRKLSFVAFVVADAISLFLSSASILTFLSILTSRYAERDFEASLPMKLMLGLAALFLSIGAMMVTFSVSFFVLYHREMKWIPIFISLFAVTPAILYVALQYHLLTDVFRSTYGGKYLFKPKKQILFYEYPKY